jgi:hypothetical protein
MNKPVILTDKEEIIRIVPGTPFRDILMNIRRNNHICLTGTYGFAMDFYAWVKKQVSAKNPANDYSAWRDQRKALHRYQSHIWIQIDCHRPALEHAPANPWLKEFYADHENFLITFADYLGLNGSRQWYEKGVHYPVIDHAIHPFYGVYFPSREDHLLLFDSWLKEQKPFRRAVDIGTGCGILAFMMQKHNIRDIHATDINPNAVFSLRQTLKSSEINIPGSIIVEQASLLGSFEPAENDLIVFNPPWIPGKAEKTLDRASYYEPGFFDRFFDEISHKCLKGNTIVLLFSNFAMLAGLTSENPIKEALKNFEETLQLVEFKKLKVRQEASKKKSWLHEIRKNEDIELFVVRKI